METFPTAGAAAQAAAEAILAQLTPPGRKRLMVTGGRSPGPVYDRLAQTDLDWSRITVTLSDERFVAADAAESNEKLVRERLLQGRAAAAKLVPLKHHGPTPVDDAAAAEGAIAALVPFDAALLGMGDDGHIASLFPSTPGVAALLSPEADRCVVGVEVPGLAPYLPRISLTGRPILASKLIVVLTGGAGRKALIERVLADPAFAPPISALIRQTRTPVRLLWSPGA
ncbi:MAG TPA: 6-phosphogluconolactonase [Caulobacteraceae bacterium]|jgi:6-phosphogluconolactonase|nr:6-phosphogluconolactonase [Caulobacteraceae bacterium]